MQIKRFRTKIIRPTSFGSRLKALRCRRKLSLEEIEEQTKIHTKYLIAIEEDDYQNLPAEVYTVGFVARYLEFLNQPDKKLTEFKNQFSVWQTEKQGRLAVQNKLKTNRVIITPRLLLGLGSFVVVALIIGYIWTQINFLTTAPNLEIISPEGKTVIEKDAVEIIGKVNQDADISINDQRVAADNNGSFSQKIKLLDGLNNIEIKVQNRFNRQTVKNIQILKSRGEGNTKI